MINELAMETSISQAASLSLLQRVGGWLTMQLTGSVDDQNKHKKEMCDNEVAQLCQVGSCYTKI